MKIKTEQINLHAFSLPGFLLPTFQKATLKSLSGFYIKKPWKILKFKCWQKESDINIGTDALVTKIIRVI